MKLAATLIGALALSGCAESAQQSQTRAEIDSLRAQVASLRAENDHLRAEMDPTRKSDLKIPPFEFTPRLQPAEAPRRDPLGRTLTVYGSGTIRQGDLTFTSEVIKAGAPTTRPVTHPAEAK